MQSRLIWSILCLVNKMSSKHNSVGLTRKFESAYLTETIKSIIGVDEAGRGPLAGPVVAAACFINPGVAIDDIDDSKMTKEEDRERLYETLTTHKGVTWAASIVSHTEIDEVNILQATMNGMTRAVEAVLKKCGQIGIESSKCIALIDGNRVPANMPVQATAIVKGDSKAFSIAAASIIAKVTRDRIMVELDAKYPLYNLAQHKGYPTAEHRSLLLQHSASDIHRLTFGPVLVALEKHGRQILDRSGALVALNVQQLANLQRLADAKSPKNKAKTQSRTMLHYFTANSTATAAKQSKPTSSVVDTDALATTTSPSKKRTRSAVASSSNALPVEDTNIIVGKTSRKKTTTVTATTATVTTTKKSAVDVNASTTKVVEKTAAKSSIRSKTEQKSATTKRSK